jgi:tetratricopeptide (TPR) repeat protein
MIDKQKEIVRKMLLTADYEQAKAALEKDFENPERWYEYAVSMSAKPVEAIEAFSHGLVYNPFNPALYFGRGRKYIGLRRYDRAIADATMAIRLDPDVWTYWYYRAVPRNLSGDAAGALKDFMQCYRMTEPNEHYPLIDWMFLCALDMGDRKKCREILDLVDTSIPPRHRMDYAYYRRVRLYKGEVKPEQMIDDDDIRKNAYIEQPNRMQLEHETLTLGLYAYYKYVGDEEKADEVLKVIAAFPPSVAFGYLKGSAAARARGFLK